MHAQIVEEVRPYRLIQDDHGRYAVLEVRCGHVYCLDCDHPRHCAEDTPEGMAQIATHWTDRDHAAQLFRELVEREEYYAERIW